MRSECIKCTRTIEPQAKRRTTNERMYRYNVTYYALENTAYRKLNKAFNCKLKNKFDVYVTDEFKIIMDGDLAIVYFKSLENRELIRTIINKVTETLGDAPDYYIYDNDLDINLDLNKTIA